MSIPEVLSDLRCLAESTKETMDRSGEFDITRLVYGDFTKTNSDLRGRATFLAYEDYEQNCMMDIAFMVHCPR